MKFGVKIMPREVILDTQGRAVEQTLRNNRYDLTQCRVGKFIELDLPAKDENEAKELVEKMTKFVLYNPLIETYEITRLP